MNTENELQINHPLSEIGCSMMYELAMERFEQIVKEKKTKSLLAIVRPPDRGPFSQKGPFNPFFAEHCLGRLFHRRFPRYEVENESVTDEVLTSGLEWFIQTFDERWWKEWLDAGLSLLNGDHGWNSREKGKHIGDYDEYENLYRKKEEIFAPKLKELYKKIMGLVTSHISDSWVSRDSHAVGRIALLVHSFTAFGDWDESPADYGITTELIPLLRTSDYVDEMDIRRIEIGKFNSKIEYLEWKVASADWPFRDEHKAGKEESCWIKPSELTGGSFHDVGLRLIARRKTVRKELEEARKREKR